MGKAISHCIHSLPGDVGIRGSEARINSLNVIGSFANYLNISRHSVLQQLAFKEGGIINAVKCRSIRSIAESMCSR